MKPFNVEMEGKSIIFKNQKIDFEMTICRLRPSIDYVIDELKRGYLWFSKPTGFND